MFPTLSPNPEIGIWNGTNDGGSVEFIAPVIPGDIFTNKMDPPEIIDETPTEGSATRTFKLVNSGRMYNQRGELVAVVKMYGHNMFLTGASARASGPPGGPSGPPGGPGGGPLPGGAPGGMARHTYTEADWAMIH